MRIKMPAVKISQGKTLKYLNVLSTFLVNHISIKYLRFTFKTTFFLQKMLMNITICRWIVDNYVRDCKVFVDILENVIIYEF